MRRKLRSGRAAGHGLPDSPLSTPPGASAGARRRAGPGGCDQRTPPLRRLSFPSSPLPSTPPRRALLGAAAVAAAVAAAAAAVPLVLRVLACGPGETFHLDSARCGPCPPDTFKAARGPWACQACPFGLSAPAASVDLMQCAPEGLLRGLTSGLSLMLKSTGVVSESPPERTWRQQAARAGVRHLVGQAEKVRQHLAAAQQTLERLVSQLNSIVLDLFDGLHAFVATSGALGYEANIFPRFCRSPEGMKGWMEALPDFAAWRRAASAVRSAGGGSGKARADAAAPSHEACSEMKRTARGVLLIVHPDKFAQAHPACPADASSLLVADFIEEYHALKSLCAARRRHDALF